MDECKCGSRALYLKLIGEAVAEVTILKDENKFLLEQIEQLQLVIEGPAS